MKVRHPNDSSIISIIINICYNTDYKSLENNDFKSVTNHNVQVKGENSIDIEPSTASKEVKGDNPIDIEPNMASKESDLNRNIRKNFARINELLEAVPLCDHLYLDIMVCHGFEIIAL
jgi:hypothetical protein